MAKLKASDVCVRASERAVLVCGGRDDLNDLPVEKWYRDANLYTIFDRTSNNRQRVVATRPAETRGNACLHHQPGTSRDGLKTCLGCGSRTRSRAGIALLQARHTPQCFQRLPRLVASTPKRAESEA
jgi:acyl-CoA dehydrogenase